MAALTVIGQVKRAIQHLNPSEVREQAERPLNIGLFGPDADSLWSMERFFCPPELSPAKRARASRILHRVHGERERSYDIEIWDDTMAIPRNAFGFDRNNPERTVHQVLEQRPDLALALARNLPPFRKPVVDQTIHAVAKENALFSLATALPDIIPLLSLPWLFGEFASDTAFLTVNQIRMTFLIAAASDCDVGYREQKGQIGSIIASAFGFRAIARQLVAKIPFGGGLLPKAAIAWTGTFVVGRSMERLFALGYGYSQEERRSAFEQLFDKGREVAASLLQRREQPT